MLIFFRFSYLRLHHEYRNSKQQWKRFNQLQFRCECINKLIADLIVQSRIRYRTISFFHPDSLYTIGSCDPVLTTFVFCKLCMWKIIVHQYSSENRKETETECEIASETKLD
ncbi:hypothetical protein LXL04_019242 [Taraxacum kok-saghyz]